MKGKSDLSTLAVMPHLLYGTQRPGMSQTCRYDVRVLLSSWRQRNREELYPGNLQSKENLQKPLGQELFLLHPAVAPSHGTVVTANGDKSSVTVSFNFPLGPAWKSVFSATQLHST